MDLSQKQLQRMMVIQKAVEGHLKLEQAAAALRRSRRQVQRLKKRFKAEDASWVLPGNTGRTPANRVSEETREKVIQLARGKYAGFNDSHLHDKLVQEEKMVLSRSTIRRILRQAKLSSPQKASASEVSQPAGAAPTRRHAVASGCQLA